MSGRRGPPKHQNTFDWQPSAGHKKNETEVGGKLRPYSEITGVCARCKEQIEWKRRYGKYKPLIDLPNVSDARNGPFVRLTISFVPLARRNRMYAPSVAAVRIK